MIVDVFNKMAQAQLDLHNMTSQVTQEQTSPVFFLDNKESTSTSLNDQMEHQPIPQKNKTLSDHNQSPETPPPPKKNYPTFLSSPIYPPVISTNSQLSTTRDDYLIPILSTNHFSFKAQLTSLYMHPPTILSHCMIKIKTSSLLLLQK